MNTAQTKRVIRANGIVPLKADKTHPTPEIDEMLRLLGNQAGAIPFYAIFPAGDPNRPITLDGVFTSPQRLVDALQRAGPSQLAAGRPAAPAGSAASVRTE